MTFTDDDLKRLREYVERLDGKIEGFWAFPFDIKALLARLEAAETASEVADNISRNGGISFGSAEAILKDYLKAWREAAGK